MRTLLLVVALWLTGCSMIPASKYLAPALPEIKLEVAKKWEKQCNNYFFWRSPRVVAYRGGNQPNLVAPHEWCRIESMSILRDRLPFDYVTNVER